MYEIKDLMKATGYTEAQVRDRLDGLRAILADGFQTGKRGKIYVSEQVLVSLRRMSELEQDQGLSPKVAQGQIVQEMAEPQGEDHNGSADPWREWVMHLQKEIERRDKMIEWLQARIEELQPLALPPKRGLVSRMRSLFQ